MKLIEFPNKKARPHKDLDNEELAVRCLLAEIKRESIQRLLSSDWDRWSVGDGIVYRKFTEEYFENSDRLYKSLSSEICRRVENIN
ncbi:hypothetical protein [Teredinibacter franksiae]|uniref:hypothetical protein n=1 Tax=Teredinibacter franksiae TaxID=2761453 RepID=UPI001628666F|nr:hypothetical protein [Teredinibacter franksiae]